MHGHDDLIVPQHHGRILYDAALQPKEYWELKVPGHVKSWTDEATRKRLLEYLGAVCTRAIGTTASHRRFQNPP